MVLPDPARLQETAEWRRESLPAGQAVRSLASCWNAADFLPTNTGGSNGFGQCAQFPETTNTLMTGGFCFRGRSNASTHLFPGDSGYLLRV